MIIRELSEKFKTQILFNPVLHQSVGCIVPQTLGVAVDGMMVVKAGTPLMVDLDDRTTSAALATSTSAMNAVLIHDTDVTHGDGNGTACIFGFINLARVEDVALQLIATARENTDATKLITFLTEA